MNRNISFIEKLARNKISKVENFNGDQALIIVALSFKNKALTKHRIEHKRGSTQTE